MLNVIRAAVAGYFLLAALIVVWNVAAAGRIVASRRAGRVFAGATALAALLLVPALVVAVSDTSLVYGRAIQTVSWIWPLVAILFTVQAAASLARGRVTPLLGVPILVYDLVIAIVAITRWSNAMGFAPPSPMLVLSAAQANALGIVAGGSTLAHATWLLVPMFAPALPSRSRLRIAVRTLLAAGVTAAVSLVLVALPAATEAIGSYARYTRDALTERPSGDLDFGLKIFPDLRGAPPPVAITHDVPVVDSLNVDALSVVVDPEGARGRALDSLAHAVDDARGDSTTLIVTLGYSRNAQREVARGTDEYFRARLADVDRLARALHPTIIVPAYEPYGEGSRAIGMRDPPVWIAYIARAAAVAHHVNRNIRVAVASSSFGPRDSTLYAWMASPSSPVDVIGLSLMPGFDGATSLDTHMRIATRWISATDRPKPHWVLASGGYPIIHGERSQLLALRGVLAWATAQTAVRGIVVTDAGDYDAQRGISAPSGRRRPVFAELAGAITAVRESSAP